MAWIDANRLAEMIGVSKYTVYEWVKADKIPAHRLGVKLIRFDLEEIEEWLKAKEPNANWRNANGSN